MNNASIISALHNVAYVLMGSSGMNGVLLRDVKVGTVVFPKGSFVRLVWNKNNPQKVSVISDEINNYFTLYSKDLYAWVKGVDRPPTVRTIEKWLDSGFAETVDGKITELDGWVNEVPSWLLALGFV